MSPCFLLRVLTLVTRFVGGLAPTMYGHPQCCCLGDLPHQCKDVHVLVHVNASLGIRKLATQM